MVFDTSRQEAHILVVDDQEMNRELLFRLLTTLGHHVHMAATGAEGILEMQENPIDLILLDLIMPVMDGYEFLEIIRGDPEFRHVPVIVISGADSMESILRAIEAGADDYLAKPFHAPLLKARLDACLVKKRIYDAETKQRRQMERFNDELSAEVQQQIRELTAAQRSTIFALSKLAEFRDPETGEHLERIREYVKILVQELMNHPQYYGELDPVFIDNMYAAAPLHDVGKVGIPDRILLKPGRLTSDEFEIMKQHVNIGADTLRAVLHQHPKNGFVRLGIEIAESHHERWDGTGYPHGRSEREIPIAGRILAVADVYDALTSNRCYKEAHDHETSYEIILEESGRQFDPDVVHAFLRSKDRFQEVRRMLPDKAVAV